MILNESVINWPIMLCCTHITTALRHVFNLLPLQKKRKSKNLSAIIAKYIFGISDLKPKKNEQLFRNFFSSRKTWNKFNWLGKITVLGKKIIIKCELKGNFWKMKWKVPRKFCDFFFLCNTCLTSELSLRRFARENFAAVSIINTLQWTFEGKRRSGENILKFFFHAMG